MAKNIKKAVKKSKQKALYIKYFNEIVSLIERAEAHVSAYGPFPRWNFMKFLHIDSTKSQPMPDKMYWKHPEDIPFWAFVECRIWKIIKVFHDLQRGKDKVRLLDVYIKSLYKMLDNGLASYTVVGDYKKGFKPILTKVCDEYRILKDPARR